MSAERPQTAVAPQSIGGGGGMWVKLLGGVLLLAVAVWFGEDIAHLLPALERWVAAHGVWGFAVFVVAVVVCTSLFVPDTIFAVAAGVLFGVLWGTVLVAIGSLLTATLNFLISRRFLQTKVRGWVAAKPRLGAVEHAVRREGLRFLFLLRLAPIHPVTVSYMLGATGVRYWVFLTASLGLIPALFVEVYFGYVAKHVAKVSGDVGERPTRHTVLTIAGLLLCAGLLIYFARLAKRALNEQGAQPANGG